MNDVLISGLIHPRYEKADCWPEGGYEDHLVVSRDFSNSPRLVSWLPGSVGKYFPQKM